MVFLVSGVLGGALRRCGRVALVLAAVGWMAGAGPAAAADPAAPFALKGAETCLKCHDKGTATNILHTAHAVKGDPNTPFAQNACESCHGASPQHLVKPPEGKPRALPAVVFRKDSPNTVEERDAPCLSCHKGGKLMNWKGSAHQFTEVSCVDCHDLHTTKDPMLAKTSQPQVCFGCHQEQRAQAHRPSHHPILEGITSCGDCHNAHGSPNPKLLAAGSTINDTCYQCHAEKRGPFLWEHAPVREDCTNCHTPHGSTNPRLLKVRAPFLCQECHMAGFHPSTAYSATGLPPAAAAQLLGRACLNCHSQVHGSNHPSGARRMR